MKRILPVQGVQPMKSKNCSLLFPALQGQGMFIPLLCLPVAWAVVVEASLHAEPSVQPKCDKILDFFST